VKLGKVGQQALTREKMASLQADVRAILSFADLHAAYAAYSTARGDEPLANERPVVSKVETSKVFVAADCDAATDQRRACIENPAVPDPSL
jgi:hypothetical protein